MNLWIAFPAWGPVFLLEQHIDDHILATSIEGEIRLGFRVSQSERIVI